jgi:hypothetical protein
MKWIYIIFVLLLFTNCCKQQKIDNNDKINTTEHFYLNDLDNNFSDNLNDNNDNNDDISSDVNYYYWYFTYEISDKGEYNKKLYLNLYKGYYVIKYNNKNFPIFDIINALHLKYYKKSGYIGISFYHRISKQEYQKFKFKDNINIFKLN